jgi:hypothetical protein
VALSYRLETALHGRSTETMINHRLENEPKSKSSKYRLPLFIALAGSIMIVIGFVIPVQGWNELLMLLGLVILLGVAFSIKILFTGDWIPTLFAENERGELKEIPPPPTLERWP